MRRLLLTTALLMPMPALSQDAALILGMERYEQLDRVRRADDVLESVDKLAALGFEVSSRANGRIAAVKGLASAFRIDADTADRLVVAVSGHFVTDGARTWLLTAEAVEPDLFTVDDAGLSLDSLLQILATRQGKSVLLLGVADPRDLDLEDSLLSAGLGTLNIPQGVTVIRASPGDAGSILSDVLTDPEAIIGARLLGNSSLTIDGYLPRDWVLMPGEVIIETPQPAVAPTADDLNAEAALWDRTTAADTVEAYRVYVSRFPRGRFVNDAEAQISAILAEPNRDARMIEDELNLNRAARRTVQTQLTLLNYNTRGVDGIFGSGSRGAITNWQQTNGFPQTSFLTRDQLNLLDAQAARRQAELDADEARARAQTEALDRSYWSETGARGDEPGFRAYLNRYPDGLFSDIAKARLGEIEDRRLGEAEAADRAAWARAEDADVIAGYQDYIASFPSGVFSDRARARIADLNAPRVSNALVAQAQDEEASLRLSGLRAQLLELRLRDLGHNPGTLDGIIDDDTRRAIANYQTGQGLTSTGYLDKETAVDLLTGSLSITLPGR